MRSECQIATYQGINLIVKECAKTATLILLSMMVFQSCEPPPKFKFERGKKLIYQVEYRDGMKKLICSETIDFIGTGEKTHFSDKQDKIFYDFHYSSSDSANFVNNPRLYPDFTYSKSWQKTFSQGIVQNENLLWMHPLRANQYRFTQDCPFPEVRFPLQVGMEWSGGVSRGTDLKSPVKWKYKVERQGTYVSSTKKTKDCWFISSIAEYGEIVNELNMVYHEHRGFILFDYNLFNGDNIKIELIGEGEVRENEYIIFEQRDERNR